MKDNAARKLRQVPVGYLRVGVDPHKKKHVAVTMTEDFLVQGKFKFTNSRDGFEEALERARANMGKAGCHGVIFAIEAASHLWRNFAYFLDEKGIPFRLINPFSLKRRREGKDLNRRKNDFRDAEVAAQLLCTGEFTETTLPQGVYAELRATYNAYRRVVEEKTRLINLLKGLLDGLFPEFTQVFKEVSGQTALRVLSVCPIPGLIDGMTEDEFIKFAREGYQGRLMKGKLLALHQAARHSAGVKAGAWSVSSEISLLAEKLCLVNRHIRQIEQTLVSLVDETEEGKYLLSITGLGYISVAGLLAELGSFRSYHNARQMIKMAGSNPTESESAGKRKNNTPMSKKGRPGLRHCGWTAVVSLLGRNPEFRTWAKRLRERPANANPLSGREIVGAGINKLLRIGFALVKKQTFYQLPWVAQLVS
jgi:transposase